MSELRTWLEEREEGARLLREFNQVVGHGPTLEGYLLRHGVEFAPGALTSDELEVVETAYERLNRPPSRGYCYHNSQRLVMADLTGQLAYCEGVSRAECGIVSHAWVVLGSKVIDITWPLDADSAEPLDPWFNRNVGAYDSSYRYLGVPFPGVDWRRYRRGCGEHDITALGNRAILAGKPWQEVLPLVGGAQSRAPVTEP